MFRRRFGVRTAWLSASVAALVITSSLVAIAPGSRGRLSRDILAQSRGSNTSLVLTQSSCASLAGSTNCNQAGMNAACIVCTTSYYSDVKSGSNGGYSPGIPGAGSCGTKYSGVCGGTAGSLTCSQVYSQGACKSPNGSPNIQE